MTCQIECTFDSIGSRNGYRLRRLGALHSGHRAALPTMYKPFPAFICWVLRRKSTRPRHCYGLGKSSLRVYDVVRRSFHLDQREENQSRLAAFKRCLNLEFPLNVFLQIEIWRGDLVAIFEIAECVEVPVLWVSGGLSR